VTAGLQSRPRAVAQREGSRSNGAMAGVPSAVGRKPRKIATPRHRKDKGKLGAPCDLLQGKPPDWKVAIFARRGKPRQLPPRQKKTNAWR